MADNTIEIILRTVDKMSADLANIEKRLGGVEDATKQTAKSFSLLGSGAVILNQGLELIEKIGGAVTSTMRDLVGEAAGAQKEFLSFSQTLKIFGSNVNATNFSKFAAGIQSTVGTTDEAVLSIGKLLTSATNLNEKGLQDLTKGIIGLSDFLGRDFNSTAVMTSNVINGLTTRIRGTNVVVGESVPLNQRLAKVLEQIGPLYELAEKNASTYSGVQKRLGAETGELKERLGAVLLPSLTSVSLKMLDVVKSLQIFVDENPKAVAAVGTLTVAIVGAAGLVPAIRLAQGALLFLVADPKILAIAVVLGAITAAVIALKAATAELSSGDIPKLQKQLEDLTKNLPTEEQIRTSPSNAMRRRRNEDLKRIDEVRKQLDELGKKAAQNANVGGAADILGPSQQTLFPPNVQEQIDQAFLSSRDVATKAAIDIRKTFAELAASTLDSSAQVSGSANDLFKAFEIRAKASIDAAVANAGIARDKMVRQFGDTPEREAAIDESFSGAISSAQATAEAENLKLFVQLSQQLLDLEIKRREQSASRATADNALEEARIDNAKALLDVELQQNLTQDQAIERANKILIAEQARLDARIQALTLQRNQLSLDVENEQSPDPEKDKIRIQEINADIQKLQTARIGLEAVVTNAASKSAENIKVNIGAQIIGQQSILDGLQQQLRTSELLEQPATRQIEILKQIEAAERRILELKKLQAEAELGKTQKLFDAGKASAADVAIAEAEVAAATARLETMRGKVDDFLVAIRKSARDTAEGIAGDFVDTLINGLTDREKGSFLKSIEAFFAATGKALVTELLKEGLGALLAPIVEDASMSSGGRRPTSVAGLLIGTLKGALGLGKEAEATKGGSTTGSKGIFEQLFGPRFSTKVPPPNDPIYQRASSTTTDTGRRMPVDALIKEQTLTPNIIDAFPSTTPEGLLPDISENLIDASGLLQDSGTTLTEGAEKILSAGFELPKLFDAVGAGLKNMFDGFSLAFTGKSGGLNFGGLAGAIGGLGSKISGLFGSGAGSISSFIGAPAGVEGPLMESGAFFSNAGGAIASLFGFAHGGLVTAPPMPMDSFLTHLPSNVTRLASGGRVTGGPTLALLGEGGEDEWVIPDSKMRKMRNGNGGSNLEQTIYIVDQRPAGMKPNDVVLIVAANAQNNGPVGKAITQVQAWNK